MPCNHFTTGLTRAIYLPTQCHYVLRFSQEPINRRLEITRWCNGWCHSLWLMLCTFAALVDCSSSLTPPTVHDDWWVGLPDWAKKRQMGYFWHLVLVLAAVGSLKFGFGAFGLLLFTGCQHSLLCKPCSSSHRRDSGCHHACLSVCLSVCLSHASIASKRRKLGSQNLHWRIAQGL